MESEFGEQYEREVSGFDLASENQVAQTTDDIKVYDVILAGVCR